MFSVLSKLKYRINKDITQAEELWDDNPSNDYYFAEICGLKRALEHIARAEAEEYTALDKWAEEQQGKDNYELTSG
tara:strand:+ start:760 stop:987 length:228 start_codon:yes stop_codon:yes gene_type:complete